ncbi:hypothetical protein [Ralstonia pseudosolanacearum]|uniref:hypothetical protein n=1 Tax=Ralstonia pseudosolanacearum TaxID=1310165 RepID=UPI003CF1CCDD
MKFSAIKLLITGNTINVLAVPVLPRNLWIGLALALIGLSLFVAGLRQLGKERRLQAARLAQSAEATRQGNGHS